MAIEAEREIAPLLQQGLGGKVILDMTQGIDVIVEDVMHILELGLGENQDGLQYLHPMGEWKNLPWDEVGRVLTEHIAPPLQRARGSLESTYTSEEGVVAFEKRSPARRSLFNQHPVIWSLDMGFDEFNRLGQGIAYYDQHASTFRVTQVPGDYPTHHRLQIRQIAL